MRASKIPKDDEDSASGSDTEKEEEIDAIAEALKAEEETEHEGQLGASDWRNVMFLLSLIALKRRSA